MPRRRQQPETPRHEAWAIPYADLLTLLLAFFVVMYAVSSLNEGKYRVVSGALNAAFRGEPAPDAAAGAAVETPPAGAAAAAAAPPTTTASAPSLDLIARRVEQAMAPLVMSDQMIVRRYADRVEIEIRNDLLFEVGSATLSEAAQTVIRDIAANLVDYPNAVRVEGHTDNLPISRPVFPSNWELSAARAAGVVRVMAASGLAPQRMAVLGLGEFQPAASNSTPEGRNANRRVLIVVLGQAASTG